MSISSIIFQAKRKEIEHLILEEGKQETKTYETPEDNYYTVLFLL
jgi:hypothetical protein